MITKSIAAIVLILGLSLASPTYAKKHHHHMKRAQTTAMRKSTHRSTKHWMHHSNSNGINNGTNSNGSNGNGTTTY